MSEEEVGTSIEERLDENEEREERELELIHREKIKTRIQRREQMKREKQEKVIREISERRDIVRVKKELKMMTKEENRIRTIINQTHSYFKLKLLDEYGKMVEKDETGVVYFGDTILPGPNNNNRVCVPHGNGKLTLSNGNVLYEGGFYEGKMHGIGTYMFDKGDRWIGGMFRSDKLHGIGKYEFHKTGIVKDAIYYDNRRICFTDELLPGVSIIFYSSQKTVKKYSEQSAIILQMRPDRKRGHYVVKMDDGMIRNVNLVTEKFDIDSKKVRITPLEGIIDSFEVKDRPKKKQVEPYETYPYGFLPYTENTRSAYDENFFFEEEKNAKDILDAKMKKNREQHMSDYLNSIEKINNDRARIFIQQEIRSYRKRVQNINANIMKEAALLEEQIKTQTKLLNHKRKLKEEKVAKSRYDQSELERHIDEVWIF